MDRPVTEDDIRIALDKMVEENGNKPISVNTKENRLADADWFARHESLLNV